MNILKSAAIVAASLVALAACQPKVDTAAETSAIQEINKAWGTGYNAGDADAVANLYTEDAMILPPGAPSVAGRAGIRDFIASDIAASGAAGLTFNVAESDDVGFSGDVAWQNGTFTVTDASGAMVDAGKYLSVFQKLDGKWLLYRDTWNSDNPPAPPAEPAAEDASKPAAG